MRGASLSNAGRCARDQGNPLIFSVHIDLQRITSASNPSNLPYPAPEHFHFYSVQGRSAKSGFSSTPASTLAGDPEFLGKSRVGSGCPVYTRSENAAGDGNTPIRIGKALTF
jgi:hypothetical protein